MSIANLVAVVHSGVLVSIALLGPGGLPYEVDRRELAARLDALLAPAFRASRMRTIATRLGVSAKALRASMDVDDPRPTAAVVIAVVRHYGVDPMWLLSGEYNGRTHREALEDPDSVMRLVARTTLRDDRSGPSALAASATAGTTPDDLHDRADGGSDRTGVRAD
jgi:hypothetical protein